MIAFAYYLLKTFVCSGLLFSYYHLALRNKLFHQWNRFYLLAAIVISLAVPCLQFNIWATPDNSSDITILRMVYSADEYVATVTANRTELSLDQWITIIYSLASTVVLAIFVLALVRIYSIIKSHSVVSIDDIKFVNTEEKSAPFSFLNYVFWNKQIDLNTTSGEHIFQHELVHVREKHSFDLLFLQFVLILFWCNPFFWLIRKELRMIHEFIADKRSVGQSDAHAFATMILQTVYPQHYTHLTNQFFHQSIKRRLAMLTKNNNPKISYISRILALPLMGFLILAFSFKQKTRIEEQQKAISERSVIDTVSSQPIAIRAYRDKSIQWVYDDSVGKKISWEAAQKMGFALDNKVFEKNFTGNTKAFVENSLKTTAEKIPVPQLKFAAPKILLDTIIDNPLIVVDGKEIGMKNSLNLNEIISMDKVQSIDILKGESATAKYGQRAKDGVIEIKSKTAFEAETTLRGKILIRGQNLSGQKPLIIIDGKESEEDLTQTEADNIESMTVLKGETATSIYGPKATNGAILITTKDGKGLTKKEVGVKEVIVDGVPFKPSEKTDQKSNLKEVVVVGYGKNKDENAVFEKVEEVAEFPGGETAWRRYLERNLNAQVPANNKAPQGNYTVVVSFVVGLKGDISELKAVSTNGYGMEEEVIRVIGKGPKWVPARQNGKDVVSRRTQPVKFVVAPR